jgi:hypothetical protein
LAKDDNDSALGMPKHCDADWDEDNVGLSFMIKSSALNICDPGDGARYAARAHQPAEPDQLPPYPPWHGPVLILAPPFTPHPRTNRIPMNAAANPANSISHPFSVFWIPNPGMSMFSGFRDCVIRNLIRAFLQHACVYRDRCEP